MQSSQVILANEPRLLRGMLKRVIAKAPGLQVVGEVTDPAKLSSLIQQTNARWVIVSLWPRGFLPSTLEFLLTEHSSLCILGVAADGSQARIKRAESPEEDLPNLSLGKLIAVLSDGPI
jgi:DNA-binding NarL/FixJ family response regulator